MNFRLSPSFLALLFLAALLSAAGAVEPPRIPDRDFEGVLLGIPSSGETPATQALQQAIDKVAEEGGGRLILREGVYLSGPLTLRSRVDLHLSEGAVLRLLPLSAESAHDDRRYLSLLSAENQTDLRLSGEGTVDGQGAAWWQAFRSNILTLRRPQLVLFNRCERVEISGLRFLNPPNSHISLRLCREVALRDLQLQAPGDSPNTDGINISGRNYLIERCKVSTGDDNIVILTHSEPAWGEPVCRDFVIRDCTLGEGHGLSIGSYTDGGIRGVLVERCTFEGTTAGIRLKSSRGRGGLVEDLVYRDLTMKAVKNPIFLSSYYPKTPKTPQADPSQPVDKTTPLWKNILIENLRAEACENSLVLWGLPEAPIQDFTLKNVTLHAKESARIYFARTVRLENADLRASRGGPRFTLQDAEVQDIPQTPHNAKLPQK